MVTLKLYMPRLDPTDGKYKIVYLPNNTAQQDPVNQQNRGSVPAEYHPDRIAAPIPDPAYVVRLDINIDENIELSGPADESKKARATIAEAALACLTGMYQTFLLPSPIPKEYPHFVGHDGYRLFFELSLEYNILQIETFQNSLQAALIFFVTFYDPNNSQRSTKLLANPFANAYSLTVVAIMVAYKIEHDTLYNNAAWSLLTGISLPALNSLELDYLAFEQLLVRCPAAMTKAEPSNPIQSRRTVPAVGTAPLPLPAYNNHAAEHSGSTDSPAIEDTPLFDEYSPDKKRPKINGNSQ